MLTGCSQPCALMQVASVELLQCDLLACHAAAGLQSIDVLVGDSKHSEEKYLSLGTATQGPNAVVTC
jgi:hypothetical protein